jgi:hypothetical protein
MPDSPVRSRAVFLIGGYDPKTPEAFFGRLERECRRSAALWSASSRFGPLAAAANGDAASVAIETEGPGWAGRTDFTFLVLDRIVLADFARPLALRLGKYLLAFAGFVLSGTAFRIFRHAWRFGLYFLFPFVCLLGFAAAALAAGWIAAWWSGRPWAGLTVGVAAFSVLLRVLGERWPVNHLMDLWSFSHAFLRGGRADAEALMARFAELIAATLRERRYDEAILVGHSTGGLLILDVAARCLALDPAFSRRAGSVSILTLGSTALKAGLHPAATGFRAGVARLAADDRLGWFEVQCMTDIINFHRTDPAALMGVRAAGADRFPLVRDVHMKRMLDPAFYRSVRRNFFRVHYQYLSGNSLRYFYDFFLICCGPAPLGARMRSREAGPFAGLPGGEAGSEHAA